jgi:hypothetical protein
MAARAQVEQYLKSSRAAATAAATATAAPSAVHKYPLAREQVATYLASRNNSGVTFPAVSAELTLLFLA